MTQYANITHDADLSEWDSTAGDVRWMSFGGHNASGSLFANGASGTARGTFDMGVISTTAYFLARINPARGFVGTPFYGISSAPADAFGVALTSDADGVIGVNLTVYTNAGSEVYALAMPYDVQGAFWVQVKITVGASQGAVQAWINDNLALAETTFGPNDTKKVRHIRAGFDIGSANERVYVDHIVVEDARITIPTWTPGMVDTWQDGALGDIPRTLERWVCVGPPTGGWQAFTDKSSGFTTLKMSAIRNAPDIIEFRDPSGGIVYRSPEGFGDAPLTDTRGKLLYPQIAPEVRFRNIDQTAVVRALVEFTT